ncbi:MAG: hypothetical protein KDI68_15330 [Gammaproteobacteria bacterium]|nr:hypothetical protein [Gammaproteobacteria bacterium]
MAKKEKKKEKQKKKEKGREKREKKLLKRLLQEDKGGKKADKKSSSNSKKMLLREIEQLKAELQARSAAAPAEHGATDAVAFTEVDELDRASDTGSISERKKTWERHQYLRAQYESHLESGSAKADARVAADRDLRQRYGDQFGYSLEDLDSILS